MLKFFKALFKRKPKINKVDIESRFQLISRVGQGSMSKVWRAHDRRLDKTVALKVLVNPGTHVAQTRQSNGNCRCHIVYTSKGG